MVAIRRSATRCRAWKSRPPRRFSSCIVLTALEHRLELRDARTGVLHPDNERLARHHLEPVARLADRPADR